jgi:hypothetical protein
MGGSPMPVSHYQQQGLQPQGQSYFVGDVRQYTNPEEWKRINNLRNDPAYGAWKQDFYDPKTGGVVSQIVGAPSTFALSAANNGLANPATRLVGIDNYASNQQSAKTTAQLSAEAAARNAAIDQQKAAYDARMAALYSGMGNFDFLNKPMEVSPFKVVNGQAILTRPTYGGQPPQTGASLSSIYSQQQSRSGSPSFGNPQVDQIYSLFSNPYLAQLATLLFQNSSWLNPDQNK